MPCHSAVKSNPLVLKESDSVEYALAALQKKGEDVALACNESGEYVGLFSYAGLFADLLPVEVSTPHGGVSLEAAPGIAKRLMKVSLLPISDFFVRNVAVVASSSPLWEGVRALMKFSGTPVVVVEEPSGKALGYVTHESMILEIERMSKD